MTETNIMQIVGDSIRVLRLRRGLTRLALGAAARIDDSQLSKMERGLRGTTPAGYARLARALGVPTSDLFVQPAPSVAMPARANATQSTSKRGTGRSHARTVRAKGRRREVTQAD